MRILVADDEPTSLETLQILLENWGHEVILARDGSKAWRILQQDDAPKLVILDWLMSGLEGPEICRKVREREKNQYTYIIMMTIKDRREDVVHGIGAGADDYITKPFDTEDLKARIMSAERKLKVHQELLAARETIRNEAMKDHLTGVLNRTTFLEMLSSEMSRSVREDTHIALAMLDIDGFKPINDTYGHQVGDEVLRQTTQRIQSNLRPFDIVGRYGGDEFLVVFTGCDTKNAGLLAERLHHLVTQDEIRIGNISIPLKISMGVTVTKSPADRSAESFIDIADKALYAAKNAGRNRIEMNEIWMTNG